MSERGDFCAICGVLEDEHPPPPPPGPPDPPPDRHEGVWRPRHAFKPSGLMVSELLDERDAQIVLWRKRAYAAEQKLNRIEAMLKGERSE